MLNSRIGFSAYTDNRYSRIIMSPAKSLYGKLSQKHIIACVAILLAVMTLALHGSALKGQWRVDDPLTVLYVIEHPSVWGNFFSPEQWQSYGAPFFTPWLTLDFWLDFQLFGLNPAAFYAHHLITVWFSAVLTFILLYRHVGVFWGSAAALFFLIGAPVVVVSQQLMSRHYITGLVFAIFAILCFFRARERKNLSFLAMAAVFYLAAMLNKEIFAPLPLVLFFIDEVSLKERFYAIAPFGFVAGCYIFWRAVMLGKIIGGYGGNRLLGSGNMITSIRSLMELFFGAGGAVIAGSILLLLAAGFLLVQEHKSRYPLVAAMVAILLPLVAITITSDVFFSRIGLFPWWGICVMVSLASASRLNRFSWRMFCFIVFAAIVIVQSLATARSYKAISAAIDVQGCFLRSQNNTKHGYIPSGKVASDIAFQYATSVLSMHAGNYVAIPFIESAPLLADSLPIYHYDTTCGCMKIIVHNEKTAIQNVLPGLLQGVRVDRSKDFLEWEFKAPNNTSCFIFFPMLNIAAQIPCFGRIFNNYPPWLQGEFRALVHTHTGQWDTSPILIFPERQEKLQWSRESALLIDR